MILFFKTVHITALLLWCAGLLALPLMLARHDQRHGQAEYARIRRYTHYSYVGVVTPAAIVAITAGTVLIFLRGVFVPWMFAKLAMVGILILLHAWIGHVTIGMGEDTTDTEPPSAVWLVTPAGVVMVVVLFLVLAKPAWDGALFPDWLLEPRGRQLWPDEVPS